MFECSKDAEIWVVDIDLGERYYFTFKAENMQYKLIDVQDINRNHLPYGEHMGDTIVRFGRKDYVLKISEDRKRMWLEEDKCLRD
jgi:hypothetical protein